LIARVDGMRFWILLILISLIVLVSVIVILVILFVRHCISSCFGVVCRIVIVLLILPCSFTGTQNERNKIRIITRITRDRL
jgi:hypothetical protein